QMRAGALKRCWRLPETRSRSPSATQAWGSKPKFFLSFLIGFPRPTPRLFAGMEGLGLGLPPCRTSFEILEGYGWPRVRAKARGRRSRSEFLCFRVLYRTKNDVGLWSYPTPAAS